MAYNSVVYISILSALANMYNIYSDGVFGGLAWSMLNQHNPIPTKSFLANISIYTARVLISLASSFALSYSEILTLGRDLYRAIIKGSIHSTFSGVVY